MDKLYYIVCEDNDTTLYEGRYQGRTRGAAVKFLKEKIGRRCLRGVVFTITEIPVPLIREIVAEVLGGKLPTEDTPVEEPAGEQEPIPTAEPVTSNGKVGNPGFGDDLWSMARAYWEQCRNLRETARRFGLSPNTVKTRARREGWNK
jgi:hypothetical protein